MPTFRRIRRSIAAILLVLHLPGCYYYVTPKGMTPREYIAAKDPKQVRLTLADSTHLVLRKPWVSADSIGGFVEAWVQSPAGAWDWDNGDPTAVPLSSVRHLEVYRTDIAASMVGLVIGIALVGAVGFLVGMSAMYGG